MNDRRPGIDDVRNFWDRRPCNVRHSPLTPGTRDYAEQVAERRYFVEPHIRGFADFAAWKGRRVLEIGCGIGTDGLQFARAGADYTGVDLSEVSLDLARRAFSAFDLPATLIHANAESVDKVVPHGAFNLVYAFGVVHHTPSPGDLVAAVRRVIKADGVFKLMLYARESWKGFMIEAGLDQPEAEHGCPIASTYTRAEVRELLDGFRIDGLKQDHIFPFVLEKYVRYEYELLPWIRAMPPPLFAVMRERLGWHLLVTAVYSFVARMQSLVMTNDIGIVQGRLSAPMPGRLQAFPWTSWTEEFARARACGFATLEWVFEADRYEENPLWSADGVARIRQQVAATDVRVDSVCADYFMAHPFFGVSEPARDEAAAVLERVIRNSAAVGVATVLLPVLEVTELKSDRDKAELLRGLRRPLDVAGELGVRIGLETELPAAEYRALVEGASHPALGIYYDVGNATAKGFDVAADVRLLGPHLCGVHIKDRRRGGPSVPLGEGDVEFPACFEALGAAAYGGPLVLQPATSDDYLGAARTHLAFVQRHQHAAAARGR